MPSSRIEYGNRKMPETRKSLAFLIEASVEHRSDGYWEPPKAAEVFEPPVAEKSYHVPENYIRNRVCVSGPF